MPLSKDHISYIRGQVQQRVAHGPLREELVDHLSCEVEELMQQGLDFHKAFRLVAKDLQDDQVVEVQNEMIKSENHTTYMLFRNNFKILLRNMRRNKSLSLINVGGLTLGLLCLFIIVIYVKQELSYDRDFSRSEDTYRITMSSTVGNSTNHIPTSFPTLGPAVKDLFPEVESYVRIFNYKYTRMTPTITVDEKTFYEERVIFADSNFFEVFDFPLLEGDAKTALNHPASIIMTEGAAKKYFGAADNAVGKNVRFNGTTELQVSGILKDLPVNTHLQFDFLIPMSGIPFSGAFRSKSILDSWQVDWFWTYLVISDPAATRKVLDGIDTITDKSIADFKTENDASFYLQPIKDVHLKSDFDYNTDLVQNGDYKSLYIFASVGVLVLLISGINFINITIALATRRYKEIGISKVLGAFKSQLRIQFLGEALLTCVLCMLICFFVLPFILPVFSALLGTDLSFDPSDDIGVVVMLVSFVILLGLSAGLYPAFFVSSFEPQRVLKGVWKPGVGGANFRRLLLAVQIGISIFLIIGTIVIFRQLEYIQDKPLGFDKEQIVMLNVRGTSIPRKYYTMKDRLESQSSILKVSSVSEPIGREVQFMTFQLEGHASDQFIKIMNVTQDFVETMGLESVQGEDFSRGSDSTAGFLINEAAARAYGWSDPVGKSIKHAFPTAPQGKVIGVVKDFNFEPLHKQIDPLVIFLGGPYWYVAAKIKSGNIDHSIAILEKTWTEFEPVKPFSFQFLDQSIQKVYDKEKRMSKVFAVFSVFSIVTACLGLFGLISFVTEQRLVEIGMRKVMGASVANIITMILKEYLLLVLACFFVAAPLSYWVMNYWLEEFAFRISWNALYFIIGLAVTTVIITLTIISRTWQAARSNPVSILRSE